MLRNFLNCACRAALAIEVSVLWSQNSRSRIGTCQLVTMALVEVHCRRAVIAHEGTLHLTKQLHRFIGSLQFPVSRSWFLQSDAMPRPFPDGTSRLGPAVCAPCDCTPRSVGAGRNRASGYSPVRWATPWKACFKSSCEQTLPCLIWGGIGRALRRRLQGGKYACSACSDVPSRAFPARRCHTGPRLCTRY